MCALPSVLCFCVNVPAECMCFQMCTYLVCWHQVDQHCVQQLLRHGVSFADDGAHQVDHVHVHLLVVAVARETGNKARGVKRSRQASLRQIFSDPSVCAQPILNEKSLIFAPWLRLTLTSTLCTLGIHVVHSLETIWPCIHCPRDCDALNTQRGDVLAHNDMH